MIGLLFFLSFGAVLFGVYKAIEKQDKNDTKEVVRKYLREVRNEKNIWVYY